MSYLLMSLWHIPSVVVVGNTLAMEAREAFYTPEHFLGLWGYRLQRRAEEHAEDTRPATVQDLVTVDVPSPSDVTAKKPLPMMPLGGHATQGQFDFGF
jgi:hypothetical protein